MHSDFQKDESNKQKKINICHKICFHVSHILQTGNKLDFFITLLGCDNVMFSYLLKDQRDNSNQRVEDFLN